MAEKLQLSDGRPDGVSMGQSVTDLISFYAVDPVARSSSALQIAILTSMTTVGQNGSSFGFSSSALFYAMVNLVDNMRTTLVNVGLMKGSA